MKIKITEAQSKLLAELNLNLSKQLTRYQKKQPVTERMDEIFGKGVYRLYYDLQSGKQIFPTAKSSTTNLQFDIKFTDELKNNIQELLNTKNYSIVDFNKNIAKNNQNNQQIKITKILNGLDNDYLKKYNLYLDSISKGLTDNSNMCVVISRHAHDIGGMSTDREEWSSCEDLGDITDVKQLSNIKDMDDDVVGDGSGLRVGQMIRDGSLIFYTIKNGDWNIQHPYSRFAHGVYCTGESQQTTYGRTVAGFTNFVHRWVKMYDSKVNNYNPEELDTIVQNYDVGKLERFYYNRGYEQSGNLSDFLRLILKYRRSDFINYILHKDNGDYNNYDIDFLNTLNNLFGKNFLNYLTPELKNTIEVKLNKFIKDIIDIQNRYANRFTDLYPNMIKNNLFSKNWAKGMSTVITPYGYYEDMVAIYNRRNLFYTFFGKKLINEILEYHNKNLNGFLTKNTAEIEFNDFVSKNVKPNQQSIVENNTMKKTIQVNEKELKTLLKDYITEGLYDNNGDQNGAVELSKKSNPNPNDLKKYTSQGLDVKLVDEEEFGAEQELSIKHKFDTDGSLNIYASKDKVKLSAVLDYMLTIKDQLKVQQALAAGRVTLFIKQAASGRYMHMGLIKSQTYNAYLQMLKNNKTTNFAAKTELNENIVRYLLK